MESIVLSVISQYLKDYVNNYRKEQLSMNFLKGHGVIRDLDINVDAINEAVFQSGAPALRFTRILINTLSISAPIMSLKSKPVVFFMDKVFVEIAEIEEILSKPKSAPPKKPATTVKYGLVDRIIDCISFEINQINVGYRTLGRVKSTSIGPWTPPVVLMELNGARFFCTNQNGVEASLDECLRVRPTKRPLLFLYKKLEIKKASVYLVNPEVWFSVADELTACSSKYVMSGINNQLKEVKTTRGYISQKIIDNMPMQMEVCMRKRMDTNTTLGIEIAFVFESVKATIRQKYLAELMHFMMGIYYCLFRTDVIKEIYGPDPHNEKGIVAATSGVTDATSSPSSAAATAATAAVAKGSQSREQQARSSFGSEEIANLDKLEAEIGTGATVAVDDERGDSWQRSSLDCDEDPPHLRSVFVIQINEASIHVPMDDIDTWPTTPTYSSSRTSSNDGSNVESIPHPLSSSSKLSGLTFNMLGMVYQSIWPEHASATESVLQWSVKRFDLTEYTGVQKIGLLRSKEPLDAFDKPLCVTLLPRGVKEYNHADLETHPGTSLLYKKDCDWPPPPLSKGLSISSELCVCELELTAKIDTLSKMNKLMTSIWDPRWETGDWGNEGELGGTLDSLMGVCSSQTAIVIGGVDVLLYPLLEVKSAIGVDAPGGSSTNPSSHTVLLPSLLELNIGLVSLVWRSTLDLSCVSSFFGWNSRSGMPPAESLPKSRTSNAGEDEPNEASQDWENHRPYGFPEDAEDLSNVLRMIVEIEEQRKLAVPTSLPSSPRKADASLSSSPRRFDADSACSGCGGKYPLLCDRFEALLSEVSLRVVSDHSGTAEHHYEPQFRRRLASASSDVGSELYGNGDAYDDDIEESSSRSAADVRSKSPSLQKRLLIRPFSLQFFRSSDPHPLLDAKKPHISTFTDPYAREYYWPSSAAMIDTYHLRVDDMMVECSMLDLVRIMQCAEALQSALDLLQLKADARQDAPLNASAGIQTPPDAADRPSSIYLASLNNVQIVIASAADHATESSDTSNGQHSSRGGVSSTSASASQQPLAPAGVGIRTPLHLAASSAPKATYTDKKHRSRAAQDSILGLSFHCVRGVFEKPSRLAAAKAVSMRPPPLCFSDLSANSPQSTFLQECVIKVSCGDLKLTSGDEVFVLATSDTTLQEALQSTVYAGIDDKLDDLFIGSAASSSSSSDGRSAAAFATFRYDSCSSVCCGDDGVDSTEVFDTDADAGTCSAHSYSSVGDRRQRRTAMSLRFPNSSSDKSPHLVVVPGILEKITNQFVVELFRGFGTVKRGTCAWWEDSVFGYLNSFIDRTVGVEPRKTALGPVAKAQLVKAEKNLNGEPLVMQLETSSLVVTIMEIARRPVIDEASVSALSIALSETSAKGTFSLRIEEDENEGSDSNSDLLFDWTLTANNVQLLLSTGVGKEKDGTVSEEVCMPFSVTAAMLKDGCSPTVFRSTIRVSDIISTLSIDASTKIWGISDRISRSLGKSRAIVAAFWCAVEGSIPLYQIYDEAALQKISFDDDGVDDRACGLRSVETVQEYRETDDTGCVPQTPSKESMSVPKAINSIYFTTPRKGADNALAGNLLSGLTPCATTPSGPLHPDFPASTMKREGSNTHLEYATPSRTAIKALGLGGDASDANDSKFKSMDAPGSDAVGADEGSYTAKPIPFDRDTATHVFRAINNDVSLPNELMTESAPVRHGCQDEVRSPSEVIATQKLLIDGVSRTLLEVYSQLRSLKGSATESSGHVAASVAALRSAYAELEELLVRLRKVALVTVGLTPTLCGWVRRSNGFLPRPPAAGGGKSSKQSTSGGVKAWAVLVQNFILFMARPYGATADYVLCLDKTFIVDPDEGDTNSHGLDSSNRGSVHGKATSSSTSTLSHVIWCISKEGTLVIDCGTEKTLWLEALSQWVVAGGALGLGDDNSTGTGGDSAHAGDATIASAARKIKRVGKGFEDAFASMRNAIRGEKSVTVAGGATQTAAIGTRAGVSDTNSATSGQLTGNATEHGKRLKGVQGMMKAFTGLSRRNGQASSMHAKSSPSLFSIGAAAASTITADSNANSATSNQRQSESANNTANVGQSSRTVSISSEAQFYQSFVAEEEDREREAASAHGDYLQYQEDDDTSTVSDLHHVDTVAVGYSRTGLGTRNPSYTSMNSVSAAVTAGTIQSTGDNGTLTPRSNYLTMPPFMQLKKTAATASQLQTSAAAVARNIAAANGPDSKAENKSPVGLELIEHVDALSAPLVHVTALVESAAVHSAELSHELDFSLRRALTHVAQSVMGMGTLNILADEIRQQDEERAAQCIAAVEQSRAAVREALQREAAMKEVVTRSEKRFAEQEAVLQACTLQHIGTVSEMSRKIYDLDEQNKILRDPEGPVPLLEGSPAYLQDVIRNLTITVTDTERLLLESEEREIMAKEEMKSVKVAAENTRTAVLGIQDEMASLQQTFKLAKLGYEARLAEEVAARRRAENEKEAMQRRLEAALAALNSLGIDEPKT